MRAVLLVLVVLIVFFEEFGWRPLAAVAAGFARWPPVARLEALIRRAPPRVALALFLVPALLLFPIKLGALWLMQAGRPTLGIALIVVAKVGGTALVGRLFILVESQLMTFAWFARCVDWWRATRDRIMAALRKSTAWRSARMLGRLWRRGAGCLLALMRRS